MGSSARFGSFLFHDLFLSGVIPGLFLGDGLVIGLSGCFRSLRIPLGISVKDRVLEIVELKSGSGLIMGDFPQRNRTRSRVFPTLPVDCPPSRSRREKERD